MVASASSNSPQGADTAGPAPAYASAPRRRGLLIALAAIVALAAIAAAAIFVIGGRAPATESPDGTSAVRADEARKEIEARKAALEEASRDVLKSPASAPPAPQGDAAPAAGGAPASAVPSAPPPRSEAAATAEPSVRPDAATPGAPRAPARAESPKPTGRGGAAPAPGAKATSPAAKALAPAAVAPVPAPTANAERWAQMNDEMSRCSSDSVIPRRQCERRIRARYCDGWWGTVPECPASRPGPGN